MIRGIVPILPTPFTADEDLDLEALEGLVEFAAHAGVSAICLPAYGSEFYKLTDSERFCVVETAVKRANGRVQVMAQSNHPSSRVAAEVAKRNEGAGAELISFAIPRLFALTEDDILRYCERVVKAVSVPVLIQDFNPGGPTVGASFVARLMNEAENFRYLKLEEPSMGAKVRAIREATKDRISILEGWGGMYLLELIPDGIAGGMPGLAMCDLFVRVFELASAGEVQAFRMYGAMLPQIVYSLQNMELYHHCEKRLLRARGLLKSTTVREPSVHLDAAAAAHIEILSRLVLDELDRQGMH